MAEPQDPFAARRWYITVTAVAALYTYYFPWFPLGRWPVVVLDPKAPQWRALRKVPSLIWSVIGAPVCAAFQGE